VGQDAPTTAPDSAAACEAACKDALRCQYYLFREDQINEPDVDDALELANGCFFKVAAATPADDTYIGFKLWTNDYVVWPVSVHYRVLQFACGMVDTCAGFKSESKVPLQTVADPEAAP
jgi:hypothetical protein